MSSILIINIALLIVPSGITVCLRLTLYNHLVFLEKRVRRLIHRSERGEQPEIVQQLETRFREASNNLEQVNTTALIDQVYSQEKVGFTSCEQIEYICRTLPNLLIAFGLLGTFLGITMNLSSLSQTINQTNASDVSSLVQELQASLKGMGIAFTTSLTGIFFSATITLINLFKNTSIAKYKLISALEDYLDNIYLPEVQGNSRLDKAVDRLVDEFTGFLGRFGTTVREAVESSLGAKIQQIVDVNKQANELACRVYTGFQESSGTISTATTEFKYAVAGFESAVAAMIANAEKYQQAAQLFENSNFPQKLAQATNKLAGIQDKFSQSAFSLSNTAETIEMAIIETRSSIQSVIQLVEEVNKVNQNSVLALELHQNNQQSLAEIIPQLFQGAQSLQLAITQLDKLENQITTRSDAWSDVQTYLTQLVKKIERSTNKVDKRIKTVCDRLEENLIKQTENHLPHLSAIATNLQQCAIHINDTKHESYRIAKLLEKQVNLNAVDRVKQKDIFNELTK
jgi:hypothetical protein